MCFRQSSCLSASLPALLKSAGDTSSWCEGTLLNNMLIHNVEKWWDKPSRLRCALRLGHSPVGHDSNIHGSCDVTAFDCFNQHVQYITTVELDRERETNWLNPDPNTLLSTSMLEVHRKQKTLTCNGYFTVMSCQWGSVSVHTIFF